MRTFWKCLLLAGGLGLFGWYLWRADLGAVFEVIGRLGWLAPVMLVPYFFVYIADCVGWRLCLPRRLNVSFPALFRIRWAGESVNNVLPTAHVGGEAVKIYLLRKRGVPADAGASSAVVSKTAQTVAQLLFILGGAFAFLKVGGDSPGLRAGMIGVLAAGVAGVAGLFWVQRRGLFGSALQLARAIRLKVGFLEKRVVKIREVDAAIAGFYTNHRGRFYGSVTMYGAGWLLDSMELYLVSHLLGMPILWTQALAVEAFTSVAKALGMWVPGSLGIQESGIVMLGNLAGLPDTLSVAYALLRRGREVLFALVGWLLLYGTDPELKTVGVKSAVQPGSAASRIDL